MKILLSGSTGLIGSELIYFLTQNNQEVVCLIRDEKKENYNNVFWNPVNNILEINRINNIDCVIHLAGENISSKRWSKNQKQKISDSRVKSTKFLIDSLLKLEKKPQTFICASAIGYYGNRGDELLNERSEKGEGFLSDVCYEWEKATEPAQEARMRVVNLRFGVILSEKGGALKKMLLPFKFGLGGKVGAGNQFMSWITLEDTIKAIEFCRTTDKINGPINIVTPNPITNKQLTKILGKQLNRPTFFTLPASAAKLVLGETVDELLLASTRVEPAVLLENGFDFKYKTINEALIALI